MFTDKQGLHVLTYSSYTHIYFVVTQIISEFLWARGREMIRKHFARLMSESLFYTDRVSIA